MTVGQFQALVYEWRNGKCFDKSSKTFVADSICAKNIGAKPAVVATAEKEESWWQKLIGGAVDILKPGEPAPDYPTAAVQPGFQQYLPYIAIGGGALILVLLLTKKGKKAS
jgi:hypothetical protein